MKLDSFHTMHKNQFKWIKDLNVSTETVKPLENMEKKFLDIGLGNHFLNMNPWAQATKAKIKNGTESN